MSSTNKTSNLGLHSWVRTDPVLCADFNENFSKIDQAIGTLQGSTGNCVIELGSYTGDDSPSKTLTFSEIPDVVLISGHGTTNTSPQTLILFPKQLYAANVAGYPLTLTKGRNTITWAHRDSAMRAANYNGGTYYYVAFRQK